MRDPMRDLSREEFIRCMEGLGTVEASAFAAFVKGGDEASCGHAPCWGGIAERFASTFPSDAERALVWTLLASHADTRVLLLFLDLNRDRRAVLQRVLADAAHLPVMVQRALVAMEEMSALIPEHVCALAPSARQLWEAGGTALERERELSEARVAELMAFRFFVPDLTDPPSEPEPGKETSWRMTPVAS